MINRVLFLLLFLLYSCGYQPLYSKKENLNFTVKELDLIGDSNINQKVINALFIKIDDNKFQKNKIILENTKTIIETSKNKQGQTESYKMIIDFKISIIDKENNLTEKIISEEFSYKNKENKFDLSQYEIDVEQNLINNIIEKITTFANI